MKRGLSITALHPMFRGHIPSVRWLSIRYHFSSMLVTMLLSALMSPSRVYADYWETVASGDFTDPWIWGIRNSVSGTLIPPPNPPPYGSECLITTNVTISYNVAYTGPSMIIRYWTGGIHVTNNATFHNAGRIEFYSRNDITTDPGAEIGNAGEIEMYPEGGYGPIISGRLVNHIGGIIRTHTGWGSLGNLFVNEGSIMVGDGSELSVGSVGGVGSWLGGHIDVGSDGVFSFAPTGIVELSAVFTGDGRVGLGSISVPVGIVIIANPVSIGTKWGQGTIMSMTELRGLSILAEGTIECWGSAGGIGSIGGTLINHGTVYIGYGVPQGSGLFYNDRSGQIIWDYDYNQYSSVNYENHGTFTKRGTGGAFLTGNFVHCVDSASHIHVESGLLSIWHSSPCLLSDSPTPLGGTIRVDSGAGFYAPAFDFYGDTLDNNGTVQVNPFTFARSSPPQVLSGVGTIYALAVNGNVQIVGTQSTSGLTLTSGAMELFDNDFYLGSATLNGAGPSHYVITNGTGKLIRSVGTSFVEFPVGTSTSYNPVTVKTETGVEDFAVNVAEGVTPAMADSSVAVQRTWRISEGTPGGNGTISFTTQWNSGEEGTAFVRDTAEGWRNNGGRWLMQAGSLIDITPGGYPAVATVATNSLSDWTIANSFTTASVPVIDAWNLVSNPVTRNPGTDSVAHLFPTASFNYAYAFQPGLGYQQRFTMANGGGYWEKFAGVDTSHIIGSLRSLDSISVSEGWNLVGSISYSVDTATIVSDPPGIRASLWYGYVGAYTASPSLVPGQGYWIKAASAGKFILDAAAFPFSRPKELVSTANATRADEFILSERYGAQQSLYIEAEPTVVSAMSELPPQGPEGTFDVRFASQKSIESANSSGQTIVMRSSNYPVTFKWNLKDEDGGGYVITDGVNGNLMAPKHISGKGELVITDPAITRLVLVKEQGVPHEFVLAQNYPNPFNPTTQIKFSVAVAGRATVEMFNILGQRVKTLFNENAEPGRYYNLRVDGSNLASGVYFYRLQSGRSVESRKLMLLR